MNDFLKRCRDPQRPQEVADRSEPPLHLVLAREYAELVQLPGDPQSQRALQEIDRLFDDLLKLGEKRP